MDSALASVCVYDEKITKSSQKKSTYSKSVNIFLSTIQLFSI